MEQQIVTKTAAEMQQQNQMNQINRSKDFFKHPL